MANASTTSIRSMLRPQERVHSLPIEGNPARVEPDHDHGDGSRHGGGTVRTGLGRSFDRPPAGYGASINRASPRLGTRSA